MHAGHIAYLCFFGVATLWLFLTPEVPGSWDQGELTNYCVMNPDAALGVGVTEHGNGTVGPDVPGRFPRPTLTPGLPEAMNTLETRH